MIHTTDVARDLRLELCSRAVETAQSFAPTLELTFESDLRAYPWMTNLLREDIVVPPLSMIACPFWNEVDLYHWHLKDLRDASIRAKKAEITQTTRAECIAALMFLAQLGIPWIVDHATDIPDDPWYLATDHYRNRDERVCALAKALRYKPQPIYLRPDAAGCSVSEQYADAELHVHNTVDPIAFITKRLERMTDICDELDRPDIRGNAWRRDARHLVPSYLLRSILHYHRYVVRMTTWAQGDTFEEIEFRAAADFLLQHVLLIDPMQNMPWTLRAQEERTTPSFFQSTIYDTHKEALERVNDGLRIVGYEFKLRAGNADGSLDAYALCTKLADLCRNPPF